MPVTLDLAVAEQVAIVGARGAGPTALLRAITLLPPPAAGRVIFAGLDLTRQRPAELRALRRRLPFVGGDPTRAFPPRITVAQALLEPLQIHRQGPSAERQARLTETLAGLGLNPGLLDRPVAALSLGLRQAVAIARALVLQPELLVSEGVVDSLEPAAAGPLLDRIAAWSRARGLAWLWSTADLALAASRADRVLRWEAGQLRPA